MSEPVPFHWVGKLLGNPKPCVFPCGHVQLIEGLNKTTVEFETAWKYMEELRARLTEARREAANN